MNHERSSSQEKGRLPAGAEGLPSEVLAGVVQRHTHDLRNALNGMEIELALLLETGDEAEREATVQRIRRELRTAEHLIQVFAAKFLAENRTAISASDLAEQWKADALRLLPERPIRWAPRSASASLETEPKLVRSLLSDLLVLASRRHAGHSLEAGCSDERGSVVFVVSCAHDSAEARDPTENLLWSCLESLAARTGGSLHRARSDSPGGWSYRLILPANAAGPQGELA